MKVACYILSLYFLLLTGMSCADAAEISDSGSTTDSVAIGVNHAGHDHEHSSQEDDCSPLCVCHCCHTHCITVLSFPLGLQAPFASIIETIHITQQPKGYHPSILQPPRS